MQQLFYDGFNSKIIENAFFQIKFEIPSLEPVEIASLPNEAVPFSKRKNITKPSKQMLVFYEHDFCFRKFVSCPQDYLEELKSIEIMSTPDCSLYRDMPLWEQIANVGVSRSIGYYMQQKGKNVIPNVRWGDERTYLKKYLGTAIAFSGIPKNSTVSIGTYGCSKKKRDKYYLEAGLDAMLCELTPQNVIVYGSYNDNIFKQYERYTNFHIIPDWTTVVHQSRKEGKHGNE